MFYFIDDVEITEEEYNSRLPEIQASAEKVFDYASKVESGEITLEEVPTEYYQEVYDIINAPEPQPYDPDQEFVDRLISEVNS